MKETTYLKYDNFHRKRSFYIYVPPFVRIDSSQIPHVWGKLQCQNKVNAPLFPSIAPEGGSGAQY